ncbi:MAG: hypothetical protein Q8N14_05725 [Candidatus Omnitrophota bacterium]|nr:hypothetical protein [Candidatus Omnitrophota bacterium]
MKILRMGRLYMMRILAVIAVLVFTAVTIPPVYCQDELAQPDIKTVKGRIGDIDWVGSKIAIRWYDSDGLGTDEITLIVTPQTKIIKGTSEISLSDLIIENSVAVQYFDSGFAGLKAIKIVVSQ